MALRSPSIVAIGVDAVGVAGGLTTSDSLEVDVEIAGMGLVVGRQASIATSGAPLPPIRRLLRGRAACSVGHQDGVVG
jgi:hypothetical protein